MSSLYTKTDRLTEAGAELQALLLIHVVQNGVLGSFSGLAPPPAAGQRRVMLRTLGSGWVGRTHLLQHMKVQPRVRMKMMKMKLLRMTYRTLHSEEEEEERQPHDEDDGEPEPHTDHRLTTVALSVTEVTPDQVLRPEGVAATLPGDWIALAPPRTAEETH